MKANCDKGSKPAFCADTATPLMECVCSTHIASLRAAWIQLWMVKPAGLMSYSESITLLPCRSILTRLDAVISSNIMP
ncbi:hypothetical protein D3C80_2108800 [compost metagenome]